MEELTLIVEMIAKLPQTALWVLIGFWAYKVIIVGSIFGVVRYAIWALHSWLIKPRHELVQIRAQLDGMTIRGEHDYLVSQIRRLVGKGVRIPTEYIHQQGIDWLREAIDDKIAKDAAK